MPVEVVVGTVDVELLVGWRMELPAGEALEVIALPGWAAEEFLVAVAASPSSPAEAAELMECVLLCRSCEKWRAIEQDPELEKSFCVNLSWNDVVGGIVPIADAFCKFASDACLDNPCELVVDDAEESLKPEVDGELGDVCTERLSAPLPLLPAFCPCAFANAFCNAALFIDGRGVSSSKEAGVVDCFSAASFRLLIVGGSDRDEHNGTSRTRQENTNEPSSKIDVSGKEENAMLSRSSLLIPRGGYRN